MTAVKRIMVGCQGAIVLGLRQSRVVEGVEKEQTAQESPMENIFLPTPWNQIEAGMAFMLDLPTLLIREDGVQGGVFDLGSTDRFVHKINLPTGEWLRSPQFLQPFNEWFAEVVGRGSSSPSHRT